MKFEIKKIFYYTFFEIKKIFRNKGLILALILVPIVMATISSFMMPEKIMEDFKVAVYNEDNSWLGRFGFLFLSQFFKWEDAVNLATYEDFLKAVKSGKYDAVVVVPKGFMQKLKDRKPTTLIFVPNPDRLHNGVAIYLVARALFSELSGIPEVKTSSTLSFLAKGGIFVDRSRKPPEIEIQVLDLKTQKLKSIRRKAIDMRDLMVPFGIAIMVIIFSMVEIGMSISNAKEIGLLDIYRTTGFSPLSFITSKFIAYFLVGFLASIESWMVFRFFKVESVGGDIPMFITFIFAVLSLTAFGMFISIISKNTKVASFLLFSVSGAMFLFGDVMFPIPENKAFLVTLSKFLPVKYVSDAIRKIMIMGYNVDLIKFDLFILLVFFIVFFGISFIFAIRLDKV